MPAQILDGRRIARAVREDLTIQARDAAGVLGRQPGLAIVRVGSEPASVVYSTALARTSDAVGISVTAVTLGPDVDADGLRASLNALNADDSVDGILMQLPLPAHLPQRLVAEAIDPRKDVDGISLRSAGNLFLRFPSFVPSTCAAVIEMLDRSSIPISGRRAVIVGASNVVGKPLAFMFLHRDATVTVCHIHTRDLPRWTRQADILTVAVGSPGLITGEMVGPGTVVVDVGITVRDDGTLAGDVEFESVSRVASALTPVPGGVGQLTNLMLLKQTLLASTLRH